MERINTAARNLQADSLARAFDGGTLRLYTGSQPSSANDSPPGILLVTINLPTPAFGDASSGVAAKAGEWVGVAVNSGNAGWFRMVGSGGVSIDGAVTETGGGGEMVLQTEDAAVLIDESVTIASYTLTQPGS